MTHDPSDARPFAAGSRLSALARGNCRGLSLSAALLAAGLQFGPVSAAPVRIAVAPGTNTYGVTLPTVIEIPDPPASMIKVNPLGLTPGLYSFNLGECAGVGRGVCTGSFSTHAAPATATGGLPVDPLASLASAFGSLSNNDGTNTPSSASSNTMPGWSAFAITLPMTQTKPIVGPIGSPGTPAQPWTQQALSVAKPPVIEMPLAQSFGLTDGSLGDLFSADPRSHGFGRSESYDRLDVAWSYTPFLSPVPEVHVTSFSLRRGNLFGEDVILWETFTSENPAAFAVELQWRIGVAAVKPLRESDPFSIDISKPSLSAEATLELLLASINEYLEVSEPQVARETWVRLNPFSLFGQDNWRMLAERIEAELPDVGAGKESNILRSDGSFRFQVRADLDQFLLPEPSRVPEPATLGLLLAGLGGLAWSRRRDRMETVSSTPGNRA